MSAPHGGQGRATVVSALAVLATCSGLHAVLAGASWFWPVTAAVLVVALAGTAGRTLVGSALTSPILGLLGLTILVTVLYTRQHAFAGVVPTLTSLTDLRRLIGFGFADIKVFAPPVYPSPNLMVLTVLGVGLVAVAVDLLAVVGERPTLAGLPLLLLLAVPAAVRTGGIGIAPFLLTATGYLALLALEAGDRTRRWGRALAGPPRESLAAEGAGGATGWRIGALALSAALIAPLAIPGAGRNVFATGNGGGSGGNSSRTVINPFVQVASQLHDQATTPLLRVRTPIPTYQRLTALEQFTDAGFALRPLTADSHAKVSKGLPTPNTGSGPIPTRALVEKVQADPRLAEPFLPVPPATTKVSVAGDWRLAEPTATIFSSRTNTRGASWTATAQLPNPTAATLRAAGTPTRPATPYSSDLAIDLQVPATLPAVVVQTARGWVNAGRARTTYDIAQTIQDRLAGPGFTYSLDVSIPAGPEGFSQFLSERVGYCEQFAATMVAMLRTLGIPARVAIGFTEGARQADGSYLITNKDAHTWPEVWFATAGWIRFEPTPLSNGNAIAPAYAPGGAAGNAPGGTPSTAPAPPSTGAPNPTAGPSPPSKLDRLAGSATASALPAAGPRDSGRLAVELALTVLLLLAAAAPALVRLAVRRRRFAGGNGAEQAASAAWQQLIEDAADLGRPVTSSASPRQAGRYLTGRLPDQPSRTALATLVAAVEQARYAPPGAELPSSAELRVAVGRVRRGLSTTLPWGRRWQVALLPPSSLRRLRNPVRDSGRALLTAMDVSVGGLIRTGQMLRRRPVSP